MFKKPLTIVLVMFTTIFPGLVVSQTISPNFTVGPDMNVARMGHHAVLLDDQSVLLIGGRGTNFTSLNSAEWFPAEQDTFIAQTMLYPHDFAAVARLQDGRILIAGGSDNLGVAPGYSHAEIYDPVSGVYTVTGSLNYARMNSSAATLTNGKVLVVGGWYDANSNAYGEIYDPESGTFSLTGALNTGRSSPIVFPTADGGALIFSGVPAYGGSIIKQVEYYDPASNTFSAVKEYLFSEEDPNWAPMTADSYSRQISAQRYNDHCSIFLAYDNSSDVTYYTLFSVDPIEKTISKLEAKTALPNSQTHYISAPVIDKDKAVAYLPALKAGTDPVELDLFAVNLQDSTLYAPDNTYTFPPSYYLGYASFQLLHNGCILVSGGHSQTGYNTNFSPVNHSLLIDPAYTYTDLPGDAPVVDFNLAFKNYPNPFNSSTSFEFNLNKSGMIKLEVVDIRGRIVAKITDRQFGAGKHTLQWNANALSSGVYFCRLISPAGLEYRKISLLK